MFLMVISFLKLMIFFWLTVIINYCLEFISHARNSVYKYSIQRMLFFSFSCRDKIPDQQLYIFLSFMRHCLKVIKHLFRRGVKPQLRRNIETCVLYFDGPNNFFFSTSVRDIVWWIKNQTRLFICRELSVFFLITSLGCAL